MKTGGRPGGVRVRRPVLHTEEDHWRDTSKEWLEEARHLVRAHPKVLVTGTETTEELGEAHAWLHQGGGEHDVSGSGDRDPNPSVWEWTE